ncbi:enterobactin ABC transporter permease [Arsenicitalea aurantiaca]|uniref:Enterobactin ABC transporter permease n=1 Tax=Arsenicitalea aurantiaca TaxID=1783274 RepID=A0A433X3H2_9HYPH|nr:iron chelate uptake ABC transporter family permease subunit [Arsenicitalea aurantiaca]RUT28618.1 enterobactin ABC transporter permease [Arsenicitalea aurantiaca]
MPASLRWSRPTLVLTALAGLALLSIVLFMTLDVRGNWGFVFQFRGRKLLALLLVAYSIAVATVLFQTVTNNRILTPSIMGFDQLYILVQTAVVYFIGIQSLLVMDTYVGFIIQVGLMVGFSWVLFQWLFLSGERSLHLLVLVGIVFGIFFRSLSSFMQRMMDPNAFQVLQDTLFASFTRVDTTLLGASMLIAALLTLILWRIRSTFDVLTLGKSTAINLGVNYKATVVTILVVVSMLVAVSTALVGPRTFFGLLVASLAHLFIGNSRHRYILPAATLLGVICLVGGQTLFERVFAFDTALSIIIEFLGGLVFIILIVRGAAR